MSTQKEQLKELPFSVTKTQLLAMYGNQMSNDFIIKQINTIIIEMRRIEPGCTPRYSKVLHVEFMEFIAIYGVPKGYAKPVEDKF